MYYCEISPIIDNKLIYYKFTKEKQESSQCQETDLVDSVEDITMNRLQPLSNKTFNGLCLLLKKTYNSLAKKNSEDKTLDTATMTCSKHLDIDINFSRAILLEDKTIIVFNDFSESQIGYLKSINRNGVLL